MLEAAYFDLKNSESINGKCLCGITLSHISLSAYCMFVDTKKKELIAENPPLDKVPLPKKDTKEKRTLSAAAYHELITTLVQQTACSALSSCAPP